MAMKTAILSFQNYHGRKIGGIGSSTIRCDWLCDADDSFIRWKHGIAYDRLILQKVYWDDLCEDFKGKKILDVCDPDWLAGAIDIVALSKKVDAITTSTEELRDEIRPYVTCPVIHVPDRINFDMLPARKEIENKKAKTAVWFGYMQNGKHILNIILETIAEAKLDLLVVSNNSFQPLNDLGVHIQNVEWQPQSAWQEIQRGDFVINPQFEHSLFRFKSNNKTIISYALGLPVANDADDVTRLCDPEERKKDLQKADEWLKRDYDIRLSGKQYNEIFEKL